MPLSCLAVAFKHNVNDCLFFRKGRRLNAVAYSGLRQLQHPRAALTCRVSLELFFKK